MGCCVSSGSVHEMGEGDWVEEDSQSEANVALKAEARNMFAMVDDDSSGFLDRAELATLIKMLVPPEEQEKLLSESELDAAMHEMDDDASGAIEFAEFFTWWKRRAALEAEAANCWSLEDVADPSAGLNEEVAVALTNGRERHSTLASTRHAGGASPRSASDTANPNEAAIAMAELGIDGDTLTGQPGAPKRKGNVRRKSVVALANKELANEAAMWTVSSAVAGGKSDEARVAQVALKREEKNMSRRGTRQRLQEAGCGCFMKSDRKKAAAARKKAAAVKKKKDLHDPRVQCRKMFDQIDDDGSGSLDVDEIPQLAALLGMKLTEEQKHAALAEMDADGSGSVDFEEFCSWWLVTGGNDDESTQFEDTTLGKQSRAWAEKSHIKVAAHAQQKRGNSLKVLANRPGMSVADMKKSSGGKKQVHSSSVWLKDDTGSGVTMWGRKTAGPAGTLGTWETALETRPQQWQTMSLWLHESDHDFVE